MYKKSLILTIVFLLFTSNLTFAYSNETYNNVISYEYKIGSASPFSDMDTLIPTFINAVALVEVEREDGLKVEHTVTNGQGFGLSCNSSYQLHAYDNQDNFLGTDNIRVTNLVRVAPNCPDSNNSDPGNGSDCGCIFNTPGWSEYMSKIDEIIASIPPPPNWNQVADTFYNRIVPKFINDLSNMLGEAPPVPSIPSLPPPLNDGGLKKPTGRNIPGLDDSIFTPEDIKNQAPKIDERQDPTGGFNILDPIGSLPSQEEFKENIPQEIDIIAPEVPEIEGEAPIPGEQEGTAPIPGEGEYTAPIPGNDEINTPIPGEGENTAPIPGNDEINTPIPGEGENTAPIPGESENNVPIPGDNGGTAPIPGNDGSAAPIPGNDGSKAPIPGEGG